MLRTTRYEYDSNEGVDKCGPTGLEVVLVSKFVMMNVMCLLIN